MSKANKIGLIDVDGHNFPNLALMKISAYHKNKGDIVDWYNPFDKYDIVYKSKVFTFSLDFSGFINNAKQIISGGTGYDLKIKLNSEIENTNPDYSIYPTYNYSLQLFSRGCIRNCPFCVVNKKEGKIRSVNPMELNPNGDHIEVMDNNFFANTEWRSAVDLLLKCKQLVNFHGVDVRIINEEQSYYLNQLKHKKQIHIAWDNPKDNLLPKIKEMLKYIKAYKIMCYVLVGFHSTIEQDLMRITKLKELKIDPFVMPFDKSNQYQKDLARWVNKFIHKSCEFKDYKPRNNFKCSEYFNHFEKMKKCDGILKT